MRSCALSIPFVLVALLGCGEKRGVTEPESGPASLQGRVPTDATSLLDAAHGKSGFEPRGKGRFRHPRFQISFCWAEVDLYCDGMTYDRSGWTVSKSWVERRSGRIEVRDSTAVHLSKEDRDVIQNLLDRFGEYETIYGPPFPAYGPSTSCRMVAMGRDTTRTIWIMTLYQETIPPTPPELRDTAIHIARIIEDALWGDAESPPN